MHPHRVYLYKDGLTTSGPVIYWMSRDQRVDDNWALIYAQKRALERKAPLGVIFCLASNFLDATWSQYDFMLRGLRCVAAALEKKNIPLFILSGPAEETIPAFIIRRNVAVAVTDFDPLRIKKEWREQAARQITIPFYEVDAHNIVPCRLSSLKQEYSARTFRPKIRRVLNEFLDPFPPIKQHPYKWDTLAHIFSWDQLPGFLKADRSVPEVKWIEPGEAAARKMLRLFIKSKLTSYDVIRNNPSADGQSQLSPYLHFGHISAQRIALEVRQSGIDKRLQDSFLEELIVRRELSDNFCFYNERYDTFDGFSRWAQATLREHARDKREYTYSLKEFENAETHDALWNAAQMEMVKTGKMHGYMRMYWAKKILEWSETAAEALHRALYLNNRYELDGRDPSGYVGCAWAIGGIHDRPWPERSVFGKIRYMSYRGCRSKFNVDEYIQKIESV
ncbi:MAG: deoxyribodipyrimidine photo-lyase [Deltaproteobacteria bacterium]|nr:deoxyribodipyrimidine photo-lyase [Deltaproteobacteria bacterium]